MAAGVAGPARFGLLEVDREHPTAGPERYLVADVLGIAAGVRLVTGPAGASLGAFVDVQEVQVLIAVAEICQLGRVRIEDDLAVMAREAQRVVFLAEGVVERGRYSAISIRKIEPPWAW